MHTIQKAKVYHFGNLEIKNQNPSSYEGPCLSCAPNLESLDAWLQIAKLKGPHTYQIIGNLSLLKLPNKNNLHTIEGLAYQKGLIEPKTAYRVYDTDEDGNKTYSEYFNKEAAEKEHEFLENGIPIQPFASYEASEMLKAYWTNKKLCPLQTKAAMIIATCDLFLPHIDGIYYNEILDIGNLSAPRIALFQRTLQKTEIEIDEENI